MRHLFIFISILSCGASQQQSYDSFGGEISSEKARSVDFLISEVSSDPQTFKVEGMIEKVCQMKGCWMTLRNDADVIIRVTFKDYGFFIPKDVNGKKVIIEGEASKELLDEDLAKHFADDEGVEYKESMRSTVSFVAHGVLIAKN